MMIAGFGLSKLLDTGAELLGLPPEMKAGAKVAVGALTANPAMILEGVVDLFQRLGNLNPPAATECWPCRSDGPRGYAPSPRGCFDPSGGGADAPDVEAPRGRGRPGFSGASSDRPATSPPPGRAAAPGESSALPPADPDLAKYEEALQVLDANFDTFDTAAGIGFRDGLVGPPDLWAIANSSTASATLKEAARFLLDRPEYARRLDAAGMGMRDGLFTRAEVRGELGRAQQALGPSSPGPAGPGEGSGSAPAGGSRPPSGTQVGGGFSLSGILNDPTLSLAEKVDRILSELGARNDQEIEGVLGELESASRAGGGKEGAGADAAGQKQQNLQLKLQQLMERRKAMFDLRTNLSSKFHEMDMRAIANLGRA